MKNNKKIKFIVTPLAILKKEDVHRFEVVESEGKLTIYATVKCYIPQLLLKPEFEKIKIASTNDPVTAHGLMATFAKQIDLIEN